MSDSPPRRSATPCFHGGAFFEAIGDGFEHLERSRLVINADVLDAWFPPAPRVLAKLQEYLPWLLRTSPPVDAAGLVSAIARQRGVPAACVLPGAGSSDLIFLALREWLTSGSRVLLLDPMYGEYAHLCERVIGCQVERFTLARERDYAIDLTAWMDRLRQGIDLAVIVNPNNPTGRHVPRERLEAALSLVPPRTRVWIDEAYVDYVGPDQSLEQFAVRRDNMIVCKSLSKGYALSGVRAAYLCGSAGLLEGLRRLTPPWAVSLPAQVAAGEALQVPDYYAARYRETAELRARLADGLRGAIPGIELVAGAANFMLCHLPAGGASVATLIEACRTEGLFLRDVSGMGTRFGTHAFRVAVKDAETQGRLLAIVRRAWSRNVTP